MTISRILLHAEVILLVLYSDFESMLCRGSVAAVIDRQMLDVYFDAGIDVTNRKATASNLFK